MRRKACGQLNQQSKGHFCLEWQVISLQQQGRPVPKLANEVQSRRDSHCSALVKRLLATNTRSRADAEAFLESVCKDC